MTESADAKDLVALVPDGNTAAAVRGILARPDALGIRSVRYDSFVHPDRDPGCLLRSDVFLRPMVRGYSRSVVMFDRQGCGREEELREDLEQQVEQRLAASGWSGRASVVVIDPELEAWVWGDSPNVDNVVGWSGREPSLQDWLRAEGFLAEGVIKPSRPKEALEQALRTVRRPRSSSLYEMLARRVSLVRCTDPAFAKLRSTLRQWFSP